MQKKRKSYWSVSEIGPSPPPLKVDADADAAADDGRVGIWKAPLPGGTAELKIQTTFHQYQKLYSTPPWHGERTCKYINAFSSYIAKTKRDGRGWTARREIINKRPPGLIAPLLKFCNLLGNPPINTTKGRDLIFNEGIRLLNMADNI